MWVSDVMSRDPITIEEGDSCHEALVRMHHRRARHLPVIGRDGSLQGIVTDRDLRHYLFAPEVFGTVGNTPVQDILRAVPVKAIMSSPVVCVSPTCEMAEAARLMREHRIGSVPVVEAGRVVGILTETDMLRTIVQADAGYFEVEQIVVSYP